MPEGTFTGRFQTIGNVQDADCVLVQEFTPDPSLIPNRDIVRRLIEDRHLKHLPQLVSGSIAIGLERMGQNERVVHVFSGTSADNRGENLGTYGELEQYKEYADNAGYERPALITSGYNVGNIVRQAGKLGIANVIVPPNLPRSFDSRSPQIWTRNRILWSVFALPRVGALALKGH
jgi:hypothetical protein